MKASAVDPMRAKSARPFEENFMVINSTLSIRINILNSYSAVVGCATTG